MKYEKPQVVVVDSTCSVVQGHPELGKREGPIDNSQDKPSVAAYEADE